MISGHEKEKLMPINILACYKLGVEAIVATLIATRNDRRSFALSQGAVWLISKKNYKLKQLVSCSQVFQVQQLEGT